MRCGKFAWLGWLGGLSGLGLCACSGRAADCTESRTCRAPVAFIDAGPVDDWWSSGGARGNGEGGSEPDAADSAGDAGEGGSGSAESTPSAEPPRVLDVSPPNGAVGVEKGAAIVVHFSRPMAGSSVEEAYQSSDLPASELSFAWNEAGTVLTLKPNAPLEYHAGGAAGVVAKTYHYGFGDLALDRAGRSLTGASFTFSTLCQISVELAADPERTGNYTDGEGEGIHNCLRSAQAPYLPTVCVGDDSNNVRYTGFLSFDLSPLPDTIVAFSSARLLADAVVYGSPELLGASRLEHVAFAELGKAALSAAASTDLGEFYGGVAIASGGRFGLSEDLTSTVRADYADRAAHSSRTQYRLGFAEISPDGAWDDIEFSTSSIRLLTTYLVP